MRYAKALRLAREELRDELAKPVLNYTRIVSLRHRIEYFASLVGDAA